MASHGELLQWGLGYESTETGVGGAWGMCGKLPHGCCRKDASHPGVSHTPVRAITVDWNV